jgi:hypothetical protein
VSRHGEEEPLSVSLTVQYDSLERQGYTVLNGGDGDIGE